MKNNHHIIEENIKVSIGKVKADLVLKNASYINVITEEVIKGDIAINNGIIVGIGNYEGNKEIDLSNKFIIPGLIDGHIHIESSMVEPSEFAKSLVIHGTTTIVTDPHEIANVAGEDGIEYMLQSTKNLPLSIYFMMPSCVPATKLDEAGATLDADIIKKYYDNDRILGLAEVMNYVGVINGEEEVLKKIVDAKKYNKIVDGHAPGLKDKELNAYVLTGIKSDHECSSFEEALEKIRCGQTVMIREGTAAKNLKSLIKLFEAPYYNYSILSTDDKHPGDLIKNGHIDYIIKEAIKLGANPIKAIKMATYNAANFFRLNNIGVIAPGYEANLVVLDNLNDFNVESVYFQGEKVVNNGKVLKEYNNPIDIKLKESICKSFHIEPTTKESFSIEEKGSNIRVMELISGQLLTREYITDRIEEDIIKLAVLERHKNTGHIGLCLLKGYGLKNGAIATSVAHDSHNLIVVGSNDEDMSLAANTVIENNGGWAIVSKGKVLGKLSLKIAGLMSFSSVAEIENDIKNMKRLAKDLGVNTGIDPFMTLGFLSLPVIPEIKLTSFGLVDVNKQTVIPTFF